ncbi:hypothetical protein G6F66_004365 [Rhizopus arrhizus]|nr:hypothetical protein G6F66_004365 [Rhizopus arrhizus]
MAYADDLAVFLVDSGELHALLDILALYSRASSARLNRHKTLAISLSGQPQQSWQSALSSHGITHANHQLSSFLDNLLLKLQQRAQMLAQRNLSILGRSLVTNTLLLGPLWHAIRVLTVPQSYLGKIRSTIIQFLARKNFPAVSFQTCQRSRKEGGLAILDPGIQHAALQLRWLQPLLLPSSDPPYYDTFVSDILRHCLHLFSVSPSHNLPLLLPNMRSNIIKFFGCFDSFFRTMDKIDWQAFDIRMINELPLKQFCPYLLLPNQDFKASYWSGILVKHVYEFGMICGKSRRRSPTPTDPFRFKNKNYFRQLQLCRIQETTFFQRFKCQHNSIHMISSVLPLPALTETDFDNILDSLLPDETLIASLNTKWFRESQLFHSSTLPASYPCASPIDWCRFWKASVPQSSHLIPNRFPDPGCEYCGGIDSEEYFVWSCPFKHEIWQIIASRFFVDPARLTYSLIQLPSSSGIEVAPSLSVTYLDIIASVLLSLWQLHWKFIFDEYQFWPQEVVARATRQILKIHKENSSRSLNS